MRCVPHVLRFDIIGSFGPARVDVDWRASSHVLPREAQPLVEEAWNQANARPGVKLFDGPMCRLESIRVDDGVDPRPAGGGGHATQHAPKGARLRIALSPTSYKAFLGTNLFHPELAERFGPGALANPVGVSSALLSSDNFVMLGRRNSAVAYYPGRLHPFAGALEPASAINVFEQVAREMHEELSLAPAQLGEMRLVAVVEDLRLRHPELVFIVKSTLSREELSGQVDPQEHVGAVATPVEAGALEALLAPLAGGDAAGPEARGADGPAASACPAPGAPARLTPVAAACLLMLGRERFGVGWFNRAAEAFI